jgi:hypothetical protein
LRDSGDIDPRPTANASAHFAVRQRPRVGGIFPITNSVRSAEGLKPVIIALTEWGDKWLQPGPVVYQNGSDGQPVDLQLRRVGDDTQVAIADVVARRRATVRPRGINEKTAPHRRRGRQHKRNRRR